MIATIMTIKAEGAVEGKVVEEGGKDVGDEAEGRKTTERKMLNLSNSRTQRAVGSKTIVTARRVRMNRTRTQVRREEKGLKRKVTKPVPMAKRTTISTKVISIRRMVVMAPRRIGMATEEQIQVGTRKTISQRVAEEKALRTIVLMPMMPSMIREVLEAKVIKVNPMTIRATQNFRNTNSSERQNHRRYHPINRNKQMILTTERVRILPSFILQKSQVLVK